MDQKQLDKSRKSLLKHFRTSLTRVSDERKSQRRTDFMRASHKAFLKRYGPPLRKHHPEI